MLETWDEAFRGYARGANPANCPAITPARCERLHFSGVRRKSGGTAKRSRPRYASGCAFSGVENGRRKWRRGRQLGAVDILRRRPDFAVIKQSHRRKPLRRADIDRTSRANRAGHTAVSAGHLLARYGFSHPRARRRYGHISHRHARHGIRAADSRRSPRRPNAAEK
jgi:hypothetical protein